MDLPILVFLSSGNYFEWGYTFWQIFQDDFYVNKLLSYHTPSLLDKKLKHFPEAFLMYSHQSIS